MITLPYGILRTTMGIFVVNEDSCLSRYVEQALTMELPDNLREISSFAQYLPPGGVAIDAGACIGDHTITYSQLVGHEGTVYAFEPHPLSYQALCLNMARLNNVVTLPLALSDVNNPVVSFRMDPNIGASCLSEEGTAVVACRTLDGVLLPTLERCDFIHLDAEGWEPRILRGGRALLERFRPTLVVEMCNKHLERAGSSEPQLLALLDELGYDVRAIPEHIEPELRDVLCVPR